MKKTKLFLFIFILLLFPLNVFAMPTTYERSNYDNLGVKKDWNITSSNRNNVLNTKLVDASEKVYDFSDVISDEDEKTIYEKIKEFVDETNMDFVFLVINEPYTNDSENEDIAADFYDYNDFGLDFKDYSGIVLLRNTYEKDPYYAFYTFGEAQLYFPSSRCDYVLDDIYNDFHSGNYVSGINTFIDKFTSYYHQGIPSNMKNYKIGEKHELLKVYVIPWIGIIGADLLVILITMIILVKKNKMVKKKLEMNAYYNNNGADYRVKTDQFIRSFVTSYTVSSSSGGNSGGGGGSHFGSSGGGHSFGGGRHG